MAGAVSQTSEGGFIDELEETLIAIFLGLMTLVQFANVVARYVFNDNILWALETTVFLFAWLVLLGCSYCVKKNSHLGVDVLVAGRSDAVKKAMGLIAVGASLIFAGLLAYGAWDYWLPFATVRSWYEVDDIRMPVFLQFLSDVMNEGEKYEKLPRFIPYFALPLGMSLLVFRLVQAGWRIMTGKQTMIIASHEVEDQLEELKRQDAASTGKGA